MAYYGIEKLNEDDYLQWLNSYLSILNDFTMHVDKQSSRHDTENAAMMISFLRVAEHVFNFFITHRSTYKNSIYLERTKKRAPANDNLPQITYDDLKAGRNNIADKIIRIIESDPKIRAHFEKFCGNLKEPRAYGFGL